jgi:hypothetical protein
VVAGWATGWASGCLPLVPLTPRQALGDAAARRRQSGYRTSGSSRQQPPAAGSSWKRRMSTIQPTIQPTLQRAYQTELDVNHEQITACKRHAGAARWAYNWGLARKQEAYRATGTSPSAIELHRELHALKLSDLPWMYAVSKCAIGAAQPGQRLLPLLSPLPAQAAGPAALSASENEEAWAGQLPPHRPHCRPARRHPAAPAGTAAPQRARLLAQPRKDPLGHGR